MQQADKRWCIFIDILGFSTLWECGWNRAIASLGTLMRDISNIGSQSYPETPDRLFVHQMGDGFAILSDYGEPSLDRPIVIASALMKYLATSGTIAAAAIAEGDFADITGCYPDDIYRVYGMNRDVDMVGGPPKCSSSCP